ncbi:MAG: RNA 2',3'-cyclic phosphodiesterase [Bacteroidales bacterium]|jgi:2'-5' RNA ligase|nr:RNA 2',3'-cyclic phosphodiesterase [Bacteroidales bacterium]
MKRLFIAVNIAPEPALREIFSRFKTMLAHEKIKWADTSNIHLTLAFLGDTKEGRINSLSLMLQEKCSGFGSFEFVIKGSGIFKDFRDPRVIWLGTGQTDQLDILAGNIKRGLDENGFPTDEREFRPHLTLGRIRSLKDTGGLRSLLEQYRDTDIQKVNVGEVILFESILMQTGPLHRVLERFPL